MLKWYRKVLVHSTPRRLKSLMCMKREMIRQNLVKIHILDVNNKIDKNFMIFFRFHDERENVNS